MPKAPDLPGSDGDLADCHDAEITIDTIVPAGLADKFDLELAVWAALANAQRPEPPPASQAAGTHACRPEILELKTRSAAAALTDQAHAMNRVAWLRCTQVFAEEESAQCRFV